MQSLVAGPLPMVIYNASCDDYFAGPRYLNDGLAAALGFQASELVEDGGLWPSRIHPEDLPHVLAGVASLAVDGSLSTEYRWRCADGAERRFLDQGTLDRNDAGDAVVRGICLDITAGISRAGTDSSMPLSSIAHEFNNMISVIIWNLEPLAKSLQGTGKTFDRTQHALLAARRCIELIEQLTAS
jgi:hypothetical protein